MDCNYVLRKVQARKGRHTIPCVLSVISKAISLQIVLKFLIWFTVPTAKISKSEKAGFITILRKRP